MTTLYCETSDCKHYNGLCAMDWATIKHGECSGYEPKQKGGDADYEKESDMGNYAYPCIIESGGTLTEGGIATSKRFCADCLNDEFGVFDSIDPYAKFKRHNWADHISYPKGFEPGVRVRLKNSFGCYISFGRTGTIANHYNLMKCQGERGNSNYPKRKAGELPIVFDDDKTAYYYFDPDWLEIIIEEE